MGFLHGWKATRLAKEYVNIAVLQETLAGLKSLPNLDDADRAAFDSFQEEWKDRLQAVVNQIGQKDANFVRLWRGAVKKQFAATKVSAMLPVLERVIARRFGMQVAGKARNLIADPSRLNQTIDGPMIRLAQLIADKIEPGKK
ncbi:MAG: hypothetical protein JW910_17440 [Anaerolineae bacterium]|nr:hypothetical protein [Anaerolineae bacterium]